MNILYRACASKENYQLHVLEELRAEKVFERCTVISQTLDSGDRYPEKYYHEIQAGHGYHASYNAICDYDALPAVPKSVWQEMLPYKSTIMDMTCRIYNMHLMTYDDMEILYIKHVRFWNWVLMSDKVEFCFFTTTPHTAWEYTIYALAKIKKIPTLIIDENWARGICSVATDISNLGSSAAECFKKYKTIGMDQESYAFYCKTKDPNNVTTKSEKRKLLKNKIKFRRKCFNKPVIKTIRKRTQMKKRFKRGDDPFITIRTIWNCNADVEYALKQKIHRQRLKSLRYYDKKLAANVSLREKYILFLLQYTPEATTVPKAGVFGNQLVTVQLLAEAAKEKGIKIYVKEHWVQDGRKAAFYNELSMIPNVYFVRTDVDNNILMKHAYMVASQTGTCIVEAFIRRIPCLMFAYNASTEAPGVYLAGSKEEIINAIDAVGTAGRMGRKKRPSEDAVRKYFAAICKTSVRSSLDWTENRKYTVQECTADIVSLITDYIGQGMPETYYYENKNMEIEVNI